MNEQIKYTMVKDNDCHWYVIPISKIEDWDKFCDSPNYGYEDLPEYAKEVGGSPMLVRFTNFEIL